MKFDLMKEKPVLDIPTLNFIWDGIWRSNCCNLGKNADERSRAAAKISIMKEIEYWADKETEKEN